MTIYSITNSEIWKEALAPSIKGTELVLKLIDNSIQKESCTSIYNKVLDSCSNKEDIIILSHPDIILSKDFIEDIKRALLYIPKNWGLLGCYSGNHWENHFLSSDLKEGEVVKEALEFEIILVVNTRTKLRFDEKLFDKFALYFEDFSYQNWYHNFPCYIFKTSIDHKFESLKGKGPAWGNYYYYRKKLISKWDIFYWEMQEKFRRLYEK